MKTWSVAELTMAVKGTLETAFPRVRVEGEISNYRPSAAGHLYFTLKDSDAVLAAAFFRGRAASSAIRPENGLKVVAEGRIDVYPPRGSYQLIVESLEPAGRGSLLEALERRKKALAAEGLFDQDRKRPLPPYPRRVAVVTSPTGAAIRDIIRVLQRRSAAPRLVILPSPVQGKDAPAVLARRIRQAGHCGLGDVAILARGGGSEEDLLPFSDEQVVRAVAACPIPVVSGVGHEIDVSLADLAADIRAATPSAAAELVSDRSEDLLLRARGFRRDGATLVRGRLDAASARLRPLSGRNLALAASSRIDEAHRRIDDGLRDALEAMGTRLDGLSRRRERADQALRDASPRAVMARGWARVSKDGRTVRNADELSAGDGILIEFERGRAGATVDSTDPNDAIERKEP